MLIEIQIELPLNLALIQWYDFKSQKHPYMYGYPYLEIKNLYQFVVIEAIQDTVHIPYIAGHSTPPMYSTPPEKFHGILKYPGTIHRKIQFRLRNL